MNLTNLTINVSSKVKKELTPEQQKANAFMKMSPIKKWEFIYDTLMKYEERISALEPKTEPEPTPDKPAETVKTYNFTSYSDQNRENQYATGTVKTTGVTKTFNEKEYTEVEVTSNSIEGFVGKKYYMQSDAKLSTNDEYNVYQLYEAAENDGTLNPVNIWVTITE